METDDIRLRRLEALVFALAKADGPRVIPRETQELLSSLEQSFRAETGLDPEDIRFYWHDYYRDRLDFYPGLNEVAQSLQSLAQSYERSSDSQRQAILEQGRRRLGELDELRHDVLQLSSGLDHLQEELHGYLVVSSLGLDLDQVPLRRFIPVRIYLEDGSSEEIDAVSSAVYRFIDYLGFSPSDDFEPEVGSWWKRLFAKSKDALSQPEIVERLQRAERAIELQTLQKSQAENDEMQARAVSVLIGSLQHSGNAAVQVGSILVVKRERENEKPEILSRTLTQKEMIFMEKNQHLLHSPLTIFESLARFNQDGNKNAGQLDSPPRPPHLDQYMRSSGPTVEEEPPRLLPGPEMPPSA